MGAFLSYCCTNEDDEEKKLLIEEDINDHTNEVRFSFGVRWFLNFELNPYFQGNYGSSGAPTTWASGNPIPNHFDNEIVIETSKEETLVDVKDAEETSHEIGTEIIFMWYTYVYIRFIFKCRYIIWLVYNRK